MNSSPSTPPAAPSYREPAINIWKRSAGRQTTLCAHFSHRVRERERDYPTSATMHNHFHGWPLAEIILATPFLPPWGMPTILQGHLSRCSGPLSARFDPVESRLQADKRRKEFSTTALTECTQPVCVVTVLVFLTLIQYLKKYWYSLPGGTI